MIEKTEETIQLPLLPYLEHEQSPRPSGFIPIYEPWLGLREEELLVEAVRSGWISSLGKFIGEFEAQFAAFCGVRHGITVSNGTTALHLALHALGIGPGDEVIVPSLTFVASANAVFYTGARPIFADVDPLTWTIDVADVERLITPHTKAIMPVHLYGHMAAMDNLTEIANQHGLWLLEDAAEAHGAAIGDRRAGGWGTIGAFSFFGNKVITTGEGGMLTTSDDALAARCRMLRDHAMPPERRYWHAEVGFNYRMTNMQAAIGVAQMERIDEFIARKRKIAQRYSSRLAEIPGLTLAAEQPGTTNIYWMVSLLVDTPFPIGRDQLIVELRRHGIDSRPFFYPLDTLPPYLSQEPRPTALRLSQQGLNLPSYPRLTDSQIDYICNILHHIAATASHA